MPDLSPLYQREKEFAPTRGISTRLLHHGTPKSRVCPYCRIVWIRSDLRDPSWLESCVRLYWNSRVDEIGMHGGKHPRARRPSRPCPAPCLGAPLRARALLAPCGTGLRHGTGTGGTGQLLPSGAAALGAILPVSALFGHKPFLLCNWMEQSWENPISTQTLQTRVYCRVKTETNSPFLGSLFPRHYPLTPGQGEASSPFCLPLRSSRAFSPPVINKPAVFFNLRYKSAVSGITAKSFRWKLFERRSFVRVMIDP